MIGYPDNPYNEFIELLTKYDALSTSQQIKKNEILFNANSIATNIYYIKSGIAKVYYYCEDRNKEITIDFHSNNDIVIPYKSFFSNVPSILSLKAITNLVYVPISKDFIRKLEKDAPLFKDLWLQLAIKKAFEFINYMIDNSIFYDTAGRYKTLIKNKSFLKKVSDEEIGLYLGVDRATIYRLKQELKEKKII